MGIFVAKVLMRRMEDLAFGVRPHGLFLASGTLKCSECGALYHVPPIPESLAVIELLVFISNNLLFIG